MSESKRDMSRTQRGWTDKEDDDLIQLWRSGVSIERISGRFETTQPEVYQRLVDLGWQAPSQDMDSTAWDVLDTRDFNALTQRALEESEEDSEDDSEDDRGWYLWKALSDLVTAQLAGGKGYHSIEQVLMHPKRWLPEAIVEKPEFEDELLDLVERIEDSFRITSKPRKLMEDLWQRSQAGSQILNLAPEELLAGYSEPYFAVFFRHGGAPVLGELSDASQLRALCGVFGLEEVDVERVAELLAKADGDISPTQALTEYVVAASQIEVFLRRLVRLVAEVGETGLADMSRHASRLSAKREEVIEELRGTDICFEEPDPEPHRTVYDYEPTDPDDYDYLQDRHDPMMPDEYESPANRGDIPEDD